ncbi:hypothetical protein [Streptomyces sp. NPDC059651]|uniref:hypothetical protein n=1 Tax=Streptomyces sp. NPDC059651 TaxID=3346897 RepID=UPI0036805E52
MSDNEDRMLEAVSHGLTVAYTGLIATCAMLPVPIALPEGLVSNLEAVPAVRRVTDIVDEQPMPEAQHAMLYTAATLWLAAMDLFDLLRVEFVEARAAGAIGILLTANDHLGDLGTWLLGENG